MPSTVRALIFHILPPETCSLNTAKKCQKYGKLLYILRLVLHKIFFCRKTKITQKKKKKTLVVHQKQNNNVLLHMSWLTLKLATQ